MSDNLFDDNEDFDDVSAPFGALDNQDMERAIERFNAEVDEKIKVLMAPKKYSAEERQAAAHWLGDAGDARAITSLIKVYKGDKKHPQVQKAAAYALGQFKALDLAIERNPGDSVGEALGRPENTEIIEHLTSIALNGVKPARSNKGLWIALSGVFLLLLLGLIVANIVIVPEENSRAYYAEIFQSLTGSPAQVAVAQIDILRTDLASDARALQQQVSSGVLDCEAEFKNPMPFAPSEAAVAALPGLSQAATTFNTVQENWATAYRTYRAACRNTPPQLSAEDSAAILESLTAASGTANSLTDLVTSLKAAADNAEAAVGATATANAILFATETQMALVTPTPSPTFTATPGLPADQINREIGLMFARISDARSVIQQLETFWLNVRDQGATQGCLSSPPQIPAPFELPAEFATFEPDIKSAADLLNTGIALSQSSFDAFQRACNNGTLPASVNTGLDSVKTIIDAYNEAERLLNVRSGRQ